MRKYKIERLPREFSRIASAAWMSLPDCELYAVGNKLVFTDDIDASDSVHCVHEEFESLADLEKYLIKMASEWLKNADTDDTMVQELEHNL